jgi:endonuclease/exonuclease/phosphatase family metal-dependent hydrolase
MTYNILFDGCWPAVRELIEANPADIICLQEVPTEDFPVPCIARPSQIRRELEGQSDYAALWRRGSRQMGNMTLVRGRIGSGTRLQTGLSQPYGLANELEVAGARLIVANLHLTEMLGPPPLAFPVSEVFRMREVLDVTARFQDARTPVIALGDFNTFWPSPACWLMRRRWRCCDPDARSRRLGTRPTYGFPFVIDHIFVRGGIQVRDCRILEGGGSDHRAVIATLDVPLS